MISIPKGQLNEGNRLIVYHGNEYIRDAVEYFEVRNEKIGPFNLIISKDIEPGTIELRQDGKLIGRISGLIIPKPTTIADI